jgi:hypothetical protein
VTAAALFEPVGPDEYLPSARARGPWDINALHGGPVAALLARAVEDPDMHLARVTLELLRPVPVAPLVVKTEVLRPGKKVQLVGASLSAGGTEVARAVGLRIRLAEFAIPAGAVDKTPPPPRVEEAAVQRHEGDWEAFHADGVEMRFTKGYFRDRGPATVWMRLCQPVVEGEEPTPTQRLAAVADFGNGVSSVLSWDRFLFINPDLTIHLARPPVGEWTCLDAQTVLASGTGVGLAESALYDDDGRVGRAVQSLLVDGR